MSEVKFRGISDHHAWPSSFPIVRTEAPLLFDKNFPAMPVFWGIVAPL